MAGDWIKIMVNLSTSPEVVALAEATGLDEDTIVGKLHRLWAWADQHTGDGTVKNITPRWVDKFLNHAGFAAAMEAPNVAWLKFDADGVHFPDFHKHNGQSAKKRVENTARQTLSRNSRDKSATDPTQHVAPNDDNSATPSQTVVAPIDDKSATRVEESREEKSLKPSSNEEGSSELAAPDSEPVASASKGSEENQENKPPAPKGSKQAPVMIFPCNGRGGQKTWGLMPELAATLKNAYPGVDFDAECNKVLAWCETHPKQLKTPKGMPAFLNGWMERQQNRSRTSAGPTSPARKGYEPK